MILYVTVVIEAGIADLNKAAMAISPHRTPLCLDIHPHERRSGFEPKYIGYDPAVQDPAWNLLTQGMLLFAFRRIHYG